jgi:NADPH-dependent 2,4-dienoyl-CoA reductase/sulfur reductase-like enzyme
MPSRRRFLAASAALGVATCFGQSAPDLQAASGGRRVVIVGGGWGGLAAASRLRRLAPALEVVLVEREAEFRSLPLSNAWLVGWRTEPPPRRDLAALAAARGWRLLRAEVTAIDRDRRRVLTAQGELGYDWLVLAAGIDYDYAPWLGDDARAIEATRRLYPAGFVATELDVLRSKLEAFRGGELLMTVPPGPARCPPAPYERALMIAWWLKARGIPGRLTLVDAGGGMARFNRTFADRYPDQIRHLTHAAVKSFDPFARVLRTEFEDLRFDHAIVIPPQRAGRLAQQAGLLEAGADGKPGQWVALDPLALHVPGDPRVYPVGDMVGTVSQLFGHYPKTAHMAVRQGQAAAAASAAQARGEPAVPNLPESICHVFTKLDPAQAMRIETSYRRRGDGLVAQTLRQVEERQPRDEDLAWARGLIEEILGMGGAGD